MLFLYSSLLVFQGYVRVRSTRRDVAAGGYSGLYGIMGVGAGTANVLQYKQTPPTPHPVSILER